MGGRIALHAAFSLNARPPDPDRREPGHPGPEGARAAQASATTQLATQIETIGVEAFAREWGSQPLFAGQPERVKAAAYADRLRNTPHGLAQALRGLGTGVMEPLWDRLPELTIPVTLITGERDEKFRALAEDMAQRLPNAHARDDPGHGHTRRSSRTRDAVAAVRIYQSGSPSSSASA